MKQLYFHTYQFVPLEKVKRGVKSVVIHIISEKPEGDSLEAMAAGYDFLNPAHDANIIHDVISGYEDDEVVK